MNKLIPYSMLSGLALAALILTACTHIEEEYAVHTQPQKITDYLYEITYNDYAPEMAYKYFRVMDNYLNGAACTVARNGNIVGRNYDYLYADMAEFIIRVPAAEGRYASIGLSGSVFELSPDATENDPDGVYFDILPYTTVDGINEKGVFCEVNLVKGDDDWLTTGTNPGAELSLYSSQLVRYVLDNCSSAAQACDELQNANLAFNGMMGELHFFVADRTESYVIEVLDNKVVCRKPKENILTNFYVLTDNFISNDDAGKTGQGTERYEYVRQHYDEMSTVDGAAGVMQGVKYSKLYDASHSPYWYSEYYGYVCNGVYIDADTPHEKYKDYIDAVIDGFKSTKRSDEEGYWITTHTSVYDLSNLTLRVYVQEDYDHPLEFHL